MNAAKNSTAKNLPCSKCFGKGRIEAFGHTDNGRCFRCGGTGIGAAHDVALQARIMANAERAMGTVEAIYRRVRGGEKVSAREVQTAFDFANGSPRWHAAAVAFDKLGYSVER